MTPFALQLRIARAACAMAQNEFSTRIGYRQSYVSAVECGNKLPKSIEFVEQAIAGLQMSETDADALREAFQQSQPTDFPPPGTPTYAYDVCATLSAVIPKLSQNDVTALREFLNLLIRVQQSPAAPKYCSAQQVP